MPKPILIHGKPSSSQLEEWFKNSEEVSFTDKEGTSYHGKIQHYKPIGDDALIWVENSRFGFYLRDVATYVTTPKIETIFVDADSASPEKVSLRTEDKTFWVNRPLRKLSASQFHVVNPSNQIES